MILILLTAFSSQAGEVVNTKTGETVRYYLDQSHNFVTIEKNLLSGTKTETVTLETARAKIRAQLAYTEHGPYGDRYLGTSVDRQTVFAFTREVWAEPDWPVVAKVVATPLTAPWDIVAMPKRLPLKGISSANYKKDQVTFAQALETSGVIEVSNRQFKRMYY